MLCKQSTALTLIVGPILDSAGAEYTGAVIGDLSISKNGGTLTALAAAATLTHIANGQYTLVLTTGNTDTLGVIQVTCNKSTYQMPTVERHVIPANVYDSLVLGSDTLDVNTLTADAAVVTAIQSGLATAAALVTIDGYLNTEIAAILEDTGTTLPAQIAALFTSALTESYRATGATGTAAQLLYEIIAHLGESSIASTTKTLKKLDGSTTAKTYTLDDATNPTSITEAT